MRIESVGRICDIRKGKNVKLCLASTSCRIDWEKDWPGDERPDEAYDCDDFEEPGLRQHSDDGIALPYLTNLWYK